MSSHLNESTKSLEWARGEETYEQWNARIAPYNVIAAFEAAEKDGTGWLLLNDYERKALEKFRWLPPHTCSLSRETWKRVCNLFVYNGSYYTLGYDRSDPYLEKIK